ncbi:hypothetical protein PsYK624_066110 [Phanerochaete sordida]|uniref:Uncharacterized protein n=1 Tax=Phanerochaete sordida TaxID=48140 RepID=A0A9P3LCQ6_9APHY|nr:hypothetical protein PsYK624_066110 [Phanerochaete sordida]
MRGHASPNGASMTSQRPPSTARSLGITYASSCEQPAITDAHELCPVHSVQNPQSRVDFAAQRLPAKPLGFIVLQPRRESDLCAMKPRRWCLSIPARPQGTPVPEDSSWETLLASRREDPSDTPKIRPAALSSIESPATSPAVRASLSGLDGAGSPRTRSTHTLFPPPVQCSRHK